MKLRLILLTLFCLLGLAIIAGPIARAFNPFEDVCTTDKAKNNSSACKIDPTKDPITGNEGVFIKIARIFAIVTGVASVIVIIVGGLGYITSSGNAEKITHAKSMILYAVIGLIVAALAQALVVLVLSKL